MFDQTIHGGRVRDSDSESDEDDSDEEEAPVQTAPTPLPAKSATAVMLVNAGSIVPPTPTPASGYITQNRPLHATVFSNGNSPPPLPAPLNDEHNVLSSTTKPVKLNIFSETPAKTPLTSRAPLVPSGSKTEAFGVFSEELPTPRQPLGTIDDFATPALSKSQERRAALTTAIPEESEEGEAEDDDQFLTGAVEEHHVNINDEEDDEDPLPRRRRFNIHEMTPITERTCEFTSQTTTLRSSQFGTTSSTKGDSVLPNENDAHTAFVQSDPAEVISGLSAVADEGDQQSPMEQTSEIFDQPVDSPRPTSGRRSGSVGSGFQLPEGFTIQAQGHMAMTMHTMVLVDGVETETMYTGRGNSSDQAWTNGSTQVAKLPNPCNPADEDVIAALLATVHPPLSALPGFHGHRGTVSARLDLLQKHAKAKVRRGSTSSRASAAADELLSLELAGKPFEIQDKIGEGGFGAVFLAVDVAARELADEASDDENDEGEDRCLVAIKVERPASMWEAVILDRIRRRVADDARSSIIRPRNLFAFQDESFLFLDYSSQGTLLDLVNKATQMGIAPAVAGAPSAVDELLAIFFTIELLKLVESLHRTNFIHGDLKIDNCLVRLETTDSATWSTIYDRSGANGWTAKGVKLIDFGRAVDLTLFPAATEQTFVADWKTDERDCVEMREARPWSYQTDYFGLASVCYCLLFGKYIQTEVANSPGTSGKSYKIATPLKRVRPIPSEFLQHGI